jgi:phage-related protein
VLASPIVLLVAAIAALAVAFATNFGGIRDLLTGMFEAIRSRVEPVLVLIRDWFINDALPKIVAFVQGTVLPAIQSFFGFLGKVWEIVGPVLGQLADWFVKTALPAVLGFISGTVIPGIQNFIGVLMGIWEKVQPVLYNLLQWFVTKGLPDIISGLQWFKEHVLDPVINLLAGLWEFVKPALEALAKWFLEEGLPKIIDIAKNLYEKVLTPLVDLLRDLWTKYAEPALKALATWFREEAPKVGQWVQDNIIKHLNELIETVKGIVTWFGEAIKKIKEFLGLQGNVQTGSGSGNNPFDPFHDYPGPYNAGQMYLVGKQAQPEAFIPKTDGYAIPNFDKLMASMGGGGPQIGPNYIYANSRAEGAAAADGLEQRFMELRQRRG